MHRRGAPAVCFSVLASSVIIVAARAGLLLPSVKGTVLLTPSDVKGTVLLTTPRNVKGTVLLTTPREHDIILPR